MSTLWYYKPHGEFHALSFRFEYPVSEYVARAYMRDWYGVKRLWPGEVWAG